MQTSNSLTIPKQNLRNQQQNNNNKILNVLVISQVHKNRIYNQYSIQLTNSAISVLKKLYENFHFYSFYQQDFPSTQPFTRDLGKDIDYILTVGNNDTLLYTFYKFQQYDTPPILGFSVQGESTLFNFGKCDMFQILEKFVSRIKDNTIYKCIECFTKFQIVKNNMKKYSTCEIQISRGANPALLKMELYLKNNQNDKKIFISKLWGDGIVISSSYGSVSRSMVLNGPIIHKKIQSFILTPICPLSLKFRPIVLPNTCDLIVKVQKNSRSAGTIYIDGIKSNLFIQPDEQIVIRKSQLQTSMIHQLNGSYEQNLFHNLQQFLSWGQQFSSLNYNKQECEKLHKN